MSRLFDSQGALAELLGPSRYATRLVHPPAGTVLHPTSTWVHYALPACMREAILG